MSLNENKIVSLNISTKPFNESLNTIINLAQKKVPSYICFANVHMTIEAYNDSAFAEMVNNADLVCADGMPLVKATKIKYKKQIERVAGMDIMPALIEAADKGSLSMFFFGTTDNTLEKIKLRVEEEFPHAKIAGMFSPPFKNLSESEKLEHINIINNSGANIVFVALGCPKQEKWMAENSKNINAVLLGVGGAFPVYAKTQKRAPKWLRDLSLEWLYRLSQDPKRLFKRYFYTNTKFVFLFIKALLIK